MMYVTSMLCLPLLLGCAARATLGRELAARTETALGARPLQDENATDDIVLVCLRNGVRLEVPGRAATRTLRVALGS